MLVSHLGEHFKVFSVLIENFNVFSTTLLGSILSLLKLIRCYLHFKF